MLKTRITEQYGLKVPFINAAMAFIATAPLVRAVCELRAVRCDHGVSACRKVHRHPLWLAFGWCAARSRRAITVATRV
jgi:hypothetical protein